MTKKTFLSSFYILIYLYSPCTSLTISLPVFGSLSVSLAKHSLVPRQSLSPPLRTARDQRSFRVEGGEPPTPKIYALQRENGKQFRLFFGHKFTGRLTKR